MGSTEWPANTAWSVDGFAIAYCSLHNLMDVTPWPTLFESQDAPYSNKDLWDIMAPETPMLPYIYADFEWSHCEDAGYPLDLVATGYDDDADDGAIASEEHPDGGDSGVTAAPNTSPPVGDPGAAPSTTMPMLGAMQELH